MFSGRYKLTERIGVGGMAEVYRAEDTVLGRIVAVKVMLSQYASDPGFTDRFRKEAASAANLQNPYIVNIYDWGQDNNNYFIVMEYVRGSDLKTGIRERGALSQRKVAEIAMQTCNALTTAHSMDIIHRDIKPQNIMVQPDGNVKVMDFGIARAKNSTKTQTGSVLGTAHYISPEQAQGKELGPATDIYSLGVVMYEAVTGKLPFDGPDAVSVAMKQVNEMPQAPSTIRKDIDPSLEAIIGMAMNKDPNKRFTTTREMQLALGDYLAGRPVNLGVGSAAKTAVIASAAGLAGAASAAAFGSSMASTNADKTGVMPRATQTPSSSAVKSNNYNNVNKAKKKKLSPAKKRGIIIALIILLVGVGVLLFNMFGSGDSVPDVVGKNVNEAKTLIVSAGFEVGKVDYQNSDTVEKDKVISQDPSSLFKKKRGEKINLVVSLGAEQVTVPNVIGKSRSDAQSILEKSGFKVELGQEEFSSKVSAGCVISQDPNGNSTANKGSTVTLIISKGSDSVSVPNVVNYTEDNAVSTLKSAGFTVSINREYSSTVDEGYVISQNPSGGKLDKGSSVTITVSRGKEQVDVPNVVGMTVAQAKSILQSAGFSVVVSGDGTDTDKVTSQSPTGTATKGATITITASKST